MTVQIPPCIEQVTAEQSRPLEVGGSMQGHFPLQPGRRAHVWLKAQVLSDLDRAPLVHSEAQRALEHIHLCVAQDQVAADLDECDCGSTLPLSGEHCQSDSEALTTKGIMMQRLNTQQLYAPCSPVAVKTTVPDSSPTMHSESRALPELLPPLLGTGLTSTTYGQPEHVCRVTPCSRLESQQLNTGLAPSLGGCNPSHQAAVAPLVCIPWTDPQDH